MTSSDAETGHFKTHYHFCAEEAVGDWGSNGPEQLPPEARSARRKVRTATEQDAQTLPATHRTRIRAVPRFGGGTLLNCACSYFAL